MLAPCMKRADVARRTRTLKKNPLKNLGAMLKLNPYAKSARRAELLAQVPPILAPAMAWHQSCCMHAWQPGLPATHSLSPKKSVSSNNAGYA